MFKDPLTVVLLIAEQVCTAQTINKNCMVIEHGDIEQQIIANAVNVTSSV